MNKYDLFQQLLSIENKVSKNDLLLNVVIIIILVLVLEFTYRRCATNISDKKQFSANFLLLGLTTMLIIIVVKSSIILSLGLVGALSVIRFRAAIKEPEELVYLFFTIGIGLGMGANLRYITIAAVLIVVSVIWLRSFFINNGEGKNLLITVTSSSTNNIFAEVYEIIVKQNKKHKIKRLNEDKNTFEISFLVEIFDNKNLDNLKKELLSLDKNINISFIDYNS